MKGSTLHCPRVLDFGEGESFCKYMASWHVCVCKGDPHHLSTCCMPGSVLGKKSDVAVAPSGLKAEVTWP